MKNELNAGAAADSSTSDEVTMSSQTIANTLVVRSYVVNVKHRETKKDAKIKIDKDAVIDFEKDYVHAPETSLFVGFDYGQISKGNAEKAKSQAGFNFYKIIEADSILNIPVSELSE